MSQNTKHSPTCNMAFGRKDPTCPRCQELMTGAAPRPSFFKSIRAQDDANRLAAIRAHDCKKSGCGPCCTRFDW